MITFYYIFREYMNGEQTAWNWNYTPSETEICQALITFYQIDTGTDITSLTQEDIAKLAWSHYEQQEYKDQLLKEYGSIDNCIKEAKTYLASANKYHTPEAITAASLLKYLFDDPTPIAEEYEDRLREYFRDDAEEDWQNSIDYD